MSDYLSPAPIEGSGYEFTYADGTEVDVQIPRSASNMVLQGFSVYPTDDPENILQSNDDATVLNVTITMDQDITLKLNYKMSV